ncbi:MAG: HAD-IIB family hydrolase [Bdellovibrionales bacterium]|nr:HAD-IIB family hydrolase [Bdellovibrionales bacterium]
MKSLAEFHARGVRILLTDIDGTLTEHGRLPPHSYEALSRLTASGFQVIPVTGRPAGWCEMIARLWPVHGVVGENGAFYFRYDGKKMRRHFVRGKAERSADRKSLREIRAEVLKEVPGSAVASDQFSRLFDLAIDFCEDVKPLSKKDIQRIVDIFHKHGAIAKVSNIHVNGWFGDYDKVSTCKLYLERQFSLSQAEMKKKCAFVGDSPNDEPMFGFLPYSFAVANIRAFLSQLKDKPAYIASREEGAGFVQIANKLLALKD